MDRLAWRFPPWAPKRGSEDLDSLVMESRDRLANLGFFGAAAVWAGQRLAPRFGTWNATLLAGLGFAVAIGVVMAVMPPLGSLAANAGQTGALLTETPQPLTDPSGAIVYPGFDADVLYWFRLYSVVAQALLWGVIGVAWSIPISTVLTSGWGYPLMISRVIRDRTAAAAAAASTAASNVNVTPSAPATASAPA